MYSLGDRSKNARSSIFHIEGDPDHPVNRGTLCPKGAGLLDFIHSPSRLTHPQYARPAPIAGIRSHGMTRSMHRQAHEAGSRQRISWRKTRRA